MFVLEKNGGALYEQIESTIIKYVANGILAQDEQLPSVRSLARELGINPNTVQRAYNNLESKGIVYKVSGKGVFVSGDSGKIDEIAKMAEEKLTEAVLNAKNAGISLSEILKTAESVFNSDYPNKS